MAVAKESFNAGPPRPPRVVVCATDFSFVSGVACDAGALLARTLGGCRTTQRIVQLDPCIADVAQTLFGVLLQAAAQQTANL